MIDKISAIKEKLYNNIYNPPIDASEISKIENKYEIVLPEEMKILYSTICNGAKLNDEIFLKKFEEIEFDSNINQCFEYTKPFIWEDEEGDIDLRNLLYGNIELADLGDNQTWNIIINGLEVGSMWFFTDVGIQPCCPRMSLFEWILCVVSNEDCFKDYELY